MESAGSLRSADEAPSAAGLRLLLVEDNQDDVLLVQTAFEGSPASHCEVVGDGMEAISYLRRLGKYRNAERPDVILLDLNLPFKNGFEVLRELKGDPTLRQIPVIVLTTSKQESDIVSSYTYGASAFITKPAGFDEFRAVMHRFLSYWTQAVLLPANLN